MLTVSRAAHRALHIEVERHGIRAATGQQHCWCHQLRSHTRATSWHHQPRYPHARAASALARRRV